MSTVADSAAPTPRANALPSLPSSMTSFRGGLDDSDDEDILNSQLPEIEDDITFSNISVSALGAELAIDRRKSSVLQRVSSPSTTIPAASMSMSSTAEEDRGRRRRTMDVQDAENSPVSANTARNSDIGLLPPKAAVSVSVAAKMQPLVEKMAALDIEAAKAVAGGSATSPNKSASPMMETPGSVPVTPRSAGSEPPIVLVQATPGAPITAPPPHEHSYTTRAVSRSRSRSRSRSKTPRSASPNTAQLRRSPRHARPEPVVSLPKIAEDAADTLSPDDIPATPTVRKAPRSPDASASLVLDVSEIAPPTEAPKQEEEEGGEDLQMEEPPVKTTDMLEELQSEAAPIDIESEFPPSNETEMQMQLDNIEFALPSIPRHEPRRTSSGPADFAAEENNTRTVTPARRSTAPTKLLAEFDPLLPQDYLIAFESPAVGGSSQPAPVVAKAPVPPGFSLLDMVGGGLGTPTSAFKYSQRDVDDMKAAMATSHKEEMEELKAAHAEELNALRAELEARHAPVLAELDQMRKLVSDYEQIMESYIEEKQKSSEQFEKKLAKVEEDHKEQLRQLEQSAKDERIKTKAEYLAREEDLQKAEEGLKKQIATLEGNVAAALNKYERLKKHAEDKLDGANVEIARVKAAYEKELVAMKGKFTKTELLLKSTQNELEAKKKENEALSALCDDMVSQLEGNEPK